MKSEDRFWQEKHVRRDEGIGRGFQETGESRDRQVGSQRPHEPLYISGRRIMKAKTKDDCYSPTHTIDGCLHRFGYLHRLIRRHPLSGIAGSTRMR